MIPHLLYFTCNEVTANIISKCVLFSEFSQARGWDDIERYKISRLQNKAEFRHNKSAYQRQTMRPTSAVRLWQWGTGKLKHAAAKYQMAITSSLLPTENGSNHRRRPWNLRLEYSPPERTVTAETCCTPAGMTLMPVESLERKQAVVTTIQVICRFWSLRSLPMKAERTGGRTWWKRSVLVISGSRKQTFKFLIQRWLFVLGMFNSTRYLAGSLVELEFWPGL